jgi:polysaccharide pyruvyl transferase WcaK-like protein
MLHSSILSLSMGVPTLNIAYDSKNVAFYELLGVEPWIHPVSELSADKLANLAAEMLSDRAALSQLVLGRIAALRDANQDFLAAVLQGLAASAFA